MSEKFDVVVIGMGPGGEVAADRPRKGRRRVAVIERELIGGECEFDLGLDLILTGLEARL